jgi:hypothetical protein
MRDPDMVLVTYKDVLIQINFMQIFSNQWVIGLSIDGKHLPTSLRSSETRQAAFDLAIERARAFIDKSVLLY